MKTINRSTEVRFAGTVAYTTAAGEKRTLEFGNFDEARRIARVLAMATGHRTTVTRLPIEPLAAERKAA